MISVVILSVVAPTRHTVTQHYDIQLQHNNENCNTKCHYAKCHCIGCHGAQFLPYEISVLGLVSLNRDISTVVLFINKFSVIMPRVNVLSVVAPRFCLLVSLNRGISTFMRRVNMFSVIRPVSLYRV
jgi:hypothetical protein